MTDTKYLIGDRVLVNRWDGVNSRLDRGIGTIQEVGELGVTYYVVKFDQTINHKDGDTYYAQDLQPFNDLAFDNCPKCFETMEKKTKSIYQCDRCKNIEVED